MQPGDRILISRWRTRRPLRILSFGYADRGADDPPADRDQSLRRALARLPAPARQVAFLTRAVPQAVPDDCRLSIAIAEACQLGRAFDGLLYPSAAMRSPAHNLALHPSCFDTGQLTLDYVEHLRVRQVTPDTDTLEVHSLNIARGADPDGRLRWLGQPGNWVLRAASTAHECRLRAGQWRG